MWGCCQGNGQRTEKILGETGKALPQEGHPQQDDGREGHLQMAWIQWRVAQHLFDVASGP